MQEVSIKIPDFVQVSSQELQMMLAVDLYENGRLSVGQAADVAGLSKRAFIETMGQYGGTLFNYPAGEIAKDAANA